MKRGRFAAAITAALLLATGQLLHSLSAFAERNNPEIAIVSNPFNGQALERLAYKRFGSIADDPDRLTDAAEAALPMAIASFRRQPLVPKSYAIAALAQRDAVARSAVLDAATELDSRDTTLQGVVLTQAVETLDFDATKSAIDKILRVQPQRSRQLFPLLIEGLKQPTSEGDFAELLDFSAPWHGKFLLEASLDAEARLTLYRLYGTLRWKSEPFQRRLIAGLAAQGELAKAEEVYRSTHRADAQHDQTQNRLAWQATYPPFDWVFVSNAKFRAQPSTDSETLNVFARPGQGGTAATRLIPVGKLSFEVGIDVEVERALRPGELTLSVTCIGATIPLSQIELVPGRNRALITAPSHGCKFSRIALRARAIRGEPVLEASLSRVRVLPSSRDTA